MSTKRQRTDNFSNEEKELLVELIKERHSIVESKDSDPQILKKKAKAWDNITQTFKARGYEREAKSLKKLYFRLKHNAKERIGKYRRELNKTGGGSCSVPEPINMDWAIADTCPIDFKEDESEFDSDATFFNTNHANNLLLPEGKLIGLMDPISGEIRIVE